MVVAVNARGAAGDGALLIPTDSEFRIILAQASDLDSLKQLRSGVAALEAVARQFSIARAEVIRLAVHRLEVERKLGAILLQTVRHGGDRSRCPDGISGAGGIPGGISPKQSALYQKLATISDSDFTTYLDGARAADSVPSTAGAVRFSAPRRPARRSRTRAGANGNRPSAAVIDAISRIMTPDVIVGSAAIGPGRVVAPDARDLWDCLRGDVLVADCPDPTCWLPMLQRLHSSALIRQALVFVPAAPCEHWFAVLQGSGVVCCFIKLSRANPASRAILHLGAGRAAFRVVMQSIGIVVST